MGYKLQLGRLLWLGLVRELHHRGADRRESGAFLLARQGSPRVTRCIYYDDLDVGCLAGGYIDFDGAGYVRLAKVCQDTKLRVIADVHTHPGTWTGQSGADEAHPMMARAGHLALIVPRFARGNRLSLKGVGAYEYLGNGAWRACRHEVELTLP